MDCKQHRRSGVMKNVKWMSFLHFTADKLYNISTRSRVSKLYCIKRATGSTLLVNRPSPLDDYARPREASSEAGTSDDIAFLYLAFPNCLC